MEEIDLNYADTIDKLMRVLGDVDYALWFAIVCLAEVRLRLPEIEDYKHNKDLYTISFIKLAMDVVSSKSQSIEARNTQGEE